MTQDEKIIELVKYALSKRDAALLFKLSHLFERKAQFEMKADELLKSLGEN